MTKKDKIFSCVVYPIIVIALFLTISAFFTIRDCGTAWELLRENKETAPSFALPTLIAYRFLIYFIPALVIFVIEIIRHKNKVLKRIVLAFNVQFITYAFIMSLTKITGLDYYCNLNIFDSMDAYILLAGLGISIATKTFIDTPIKEPEE